MNRDQMNFFFRMELFYLKYLLCGLTITFMVVISLLLVYELEGL